MLSFTQFLKEAIADYRASYYTRRNSEPGKYDTDFYHKGVDSLKDEHGKTLAFKAKLTSKEGKEPQWLGDIHPKQEGIIHRGMSHGEYHNMLKSGRIHSKGTHNIGDSQKGLTYYSHEPDSAASYASSFAPRKFKPTFHKPAYVVSIRHPGKEHEAPRVPGTGAHEVGIKGPVSTDHITAVHRARVIRSHDGQSTVHWERIK